MFDFYCFVKEFWPLYFPYCPATPRLSCFRHDFWGAQTILEGNDKVWCYWLFCHRRQKECNTTGIQLAHPCSYVTSPMNVEYPVWFLCKTKQLLGSPAIVKHILSWTFWLGFFFCECCAYLTVWLPVGMWVALNKTCNSNLHQNS